MVATRYPNSPDVVGLGRWQETLPDLTTDFAEQTAAKEGERDRDGQDPLHRRCDDIGGPGKYLEFMFLLINGNQISANPQNQRLEW